MGMRKIAIHLAASIPAMMSMSCGNADQEIESDIFFEYIKIRADGKSLLALITIGIRTGSCFSAFVTGKDVSKTIQAIKFFFNRFIISMGDAYGISVRCRMRQFSITFQHQFPCHSYAPMSHSAPYRTDPSTSRNCPISSASPMHGEVESR